MDGADSIIGLPKRFGLDRVSGKAAAERPELIDRFRVGVYGKRGKRDCCQARERPHPDAPHGRLRPDGFSLSVAISARDVNAARR